jgi:hypothetical protein
VVGGKYAPLAPDRVHEEVDFSRILVVQPGQHASRRGDLVNVCHPEHVLEHITRRFFPNPHENVAPILQHVHTVRLEFFGAEPGGGGQRREGYAAAAVVFCRDAWQVVHRKITRVNRRHRGDRGRGHAFQQPERPEIVKINVSLVWAISRRNVVGGKYLPVVRARVQP